MKMESFRPATCQYTYVVESMKWVIFPSNPWIKKWDFMILVLLIVLLFIIPYQIGVSVGYYLFESTVWLCVVVTINSIFFVDTFLYFWRAYRTPEGRIIFNLKKIRTHYIRSYFFINLISIMPSTLIFYSVVRKEHVKSDNNGGPLDTDFAVIIKVLDLCKLVRFVRFGSILKSSSVITDLQNKFQSHTLALIKYTFLICCATHWFACMWSFVAFLGSKTFSSNHLDHSTWLTVWYENNYVEGGLNPIGWDKSLGRYWLSLFWALQTITSIGYGNIVPVTEMEYQFACILQILAGIMWATVIGGLVGVTAAMFMRQNEHRARVDQAKKLITHLKRIDTQNEHDDFHRRMTKDLSRSVKLYVNSQNWASENTCFVSDLQQNFPILSSLSPELHRVSSLLIMKKTLDLIPYLSSRYLDATEQTDLAQACIFLEYPGGEHISMDEGVLDFGRGIFVVQQGCAIAQVGFECINSNSVMLRLGIRHLYLGVNSAFDDGKVLLEDGHPATRGKLSFLVFTKVIFIPRTAIMKALAGNEKAWKECARWRYLKVLLRDLDWTAIRDASHG